MKFSLHVLAFAVLWILLCGCPAPTMENVDLKKFQKQKFDFKRKARTSFNAISFAYPDFFQTGEKDHLYKKEGISLVSYDLGVYLSVESFSQSEADQFVSEYDGEEISRVRAVHNFYLDERRKSFLYFENSINTELPAGCRFDGSMEVLYGRSDYYDDDLKYFIATLEKNGEYYVFQLVSTQEMSAYLWDDFEDILKSVY